MPKLAAVKASNAKYAPATTPVIIVTGATSGIGQAIVETFARYTKGRAHIILVGRNASAAATIIASLPPAVEAEGGKYEFISTDLTLLKNTKDLAETIKTKVTKINFLVHCAGVIGLGAREDTAEGIDRMLAVRYYQKFILTNELLPLLRIARKAGEEAKVITTVSAGMAIKLDLDDLGLQKTYGAVKAMGQTGAYLDVALQEFARREPTISFIHTYPGSVNTNIASGLPLIVRGIMFLLYPLLLLVLMTPTACAEYTMYVLLNSKEGFGRYNDSAEDIGKKNFPDSASEEVQAEKVWKHSVEVTGVDFVPADTSS